MFDPGTNSIKSISVEDVKKSLGEGEDILLVDVRTPGEYEKAKITGSINIPLDEIPRKAESLFPDKNRKIYVYCLSGSRSEIVAKLLSELGFKNVFDTKNGLLAWRSKGYP